MKRFLRLVSAAAWLLTASCGAPYTRGLKPMEPSDYQSNKARGEHLAIFAPRYQEPNTVLYRCLVDGKFLVKRFHLSGLLLFKFDKPYDVRAVFTNEMGFTYFDFIWKGDSFSVASIIPQLDKPAVIKTLRKDIQLLLVRNLGERSYYQRDSLLYYKAALDKGSAYYVIAGQRLNLRRVDVVGKRRPVTTIHIFRDPCCAGVPDSFSAVHHKAHFTINGKKIDKKDE